MDECASLEETLAIAQTVLADLEKKAAGYTSLTIPSHLNLELKDKRQEVESLKARLKAAQSAKKETQQSAQSGMNCQSPMRSQVPDKYRTYALTGFGLCVDRLNDPKKGC